MTRKRFKCLKCKNKHFDIYTENGGIMVVCHSCKSIVLDGRPKQSEDPGVGRAVKEAIGNAADV